uniref:DNA polymerase delta 4, accessory subunit n=1 Tax=Ovis aries TaxID=9940 RepID=A0AC11E457_SHEEP
FTDEGLGVQHTLASCTVWKCGIFLNRGQCQAVGPRGSGRGEEPLTLSVDEAELELLRQFDLAWQYGPCTGITRLQRWHRAEQMGLKPPPEVRQVLQSHPGDPRFQCSLWHFYPL